MYKLLDADSISKELTSYGQDAWKLFYAGFLFSKFNLTETNDLSKIINLLESFQKLNITQS